MNRAHNIEDISFSGTVIRMRVDGKVYEIDLALSSRRLARASQQQLEAMEVSPSGYGLHWPDLDEDLSVDGLIGIVHQPPSRDHASDTATDGTHSPSP
jgi:hypothetical protein